MTTAAEQLTAAFTSTCPACKRRMIAGRSKIALGQSGRWVHLACADTPRQSPVVLSAADRRQLLEAAQNAYADGWGRWEADEPIKSVARRLGINVDAVAIESVITEAYGSEEG